MTTHFNALAEEEAERLALLIEECAEVQAMACKVLRHGYLGRNPLDPASRTNRAELSKELGHLRFAIALMVSEGDFLIEDILHHEAYKRKTIAQWLHHNRPASEVQDA